ncbi:UNVERIFIED_CONTAM: Josephin-like protein [Sesamum calycinum]|uniref:ubiquitinyl hydrolase 1 n=1 Tax=Sesamum calycinum TaxID=2727403 RepID=A0AAW2SC19_9LAMI
MVSFIRVSKTFLLCLVLCFVKVEHRKLLNCDPGAFEIMFWNYDINVLIAALEERGKSVIWHDRRCGASSIDLDGPEDKLFGIVLNVPVRRYGGLWRSRHWIALRRVERVWYNLDSDLSAPYPFKNTEEIRGFLDGVISTGGEVLLVMNGEG